MEIGKTGRRSQIFGIIADWLDKQQVYGLGETEEATWSYIQKVAADLGYGAPFDWEQKAINAFLIEKGAGCLACFAAWGFYHDFKVAEARNNYAA